MKVIDLANGVRPLNEAIHQPETDEMKVISPEGRHAVAVGAVAEHYVHVEGNVGYYCGGMNQRASIKVEGHAGPGLAENIMSGRVHVTGNAAQYCAATGHGGLVVIEGDAAARCGISMKGVNIVVRGNIGHMSAFMAQKGAMVVCGNAGEALGDSIYEARLYVRGDVASLGADCIEKPMRKEHLDQVAELLIEAGFDDVDPASFKRYGSARELYHFNIDNASAY